MNQPTLTHVKLPVKIETIEAMLPHRYPFLLVDRVTELEPGKRIKGYKCVSNNEPFFTGHFQGHPVMPGVLVVEAMAQCGGLLTQLTALEKNGGVMPEEEQLFYLVKIDNARFSNMVQPGDCLVMEVELARTIRNMAMYSCKATVDGAVVATCDVLCAAAS